MSEYTFPSTFIKVPVYATYKPAEPTYMTAKNHVSINNGVTVKEYLASIPMVGDEQLGPQTVSFQTFDPTIEPDGKTALGFFNGCEDAINRICNSIQYHTEAGIEDLARFIAEINVPTSELIEEDIAINHLKVDPDLDFSDPTKNAYQWAKNAILAQDPWMALDIDRMRLSETCSEGLVVLLKETLRIGNLVALKEMCRTIIRAARYDLGVFEDEEKAKEKFTLKANELYRRWYKVLNFMASERHVVPTRKARCFTAIHGAVYASIFAGANKQFSEKKIVVAEMFPLVSKEIVAQIVGHQTSTLNELDNPDWVESYTGEIDMKPEDRITIKDEKDVEITAYSAEFNIFDKITAWSMDDPLYAEAERITEIVGSEMPKVDRNFGERLIRAIRHNPDSNEVTQFNALISERNMRLLAVTESFDSEDGLEEMYHEDWNTDVAEHDVSDPMWMTAQEDLKRSDEYSDLNTMDCVKNARKAIRYVFSREKQVSLLQGIDPSHEWLAEKCKIAFHAGYEERTQMKDGSFERKDRPAPADEIINWLNANMITEQFLPTEFVGFCKHKFSSDTKALKKLNTWYRYVRPNLKTTSEIEKSLTTMLGPDNAYIALNWLSQRFVALNLVDVGYLFLSLESEFGFNEEDAEKIDISQAHAKFSNLAQWLGQFEEEMTENMNLEGRFSPMQDPFIEKLSFSTSADVEKMGSSTLDEICKKAEAHCAKLRAEGKKVDAFNTPEFIRAVIETNINSRVTVFKDTDGTFKSLPQANGWSAWMAKFNPFAFKAYEAARRDGKSIEDAKSAFWTTVKTPAAKKMEAVTGMSNLGLTLSSGRKIDWGIAAVKFKAGEIEITAEKRASMKAALIAKDLAPQLVKVL